MTKHILVIATLIAFVTPAMAREYTLKEIVQRYMEYSPTIRAARANYMVSYYDKKQAVSRIFPSISLNGSVTEYENPAITSVSGVSTTGKRYIGTIDLVQPLFAGGAVWNGLEYANLNKSLQEQNYLSVKQDSLGTILTAALQIGALKEQIRILTESQKYQERFYKLTQGKFKRGAAKNYELSQARANYLAYGSRIANLKNLYEDAQSRLRVNLGLEKTEVVDFTLPNPSKVESMEFEKLLAQAIQNRPQLRAAELGVEVAKKAKWLALAEDLPSANIVGSLGYQSPTQEDFSKDNTRFHSIGVTLKIPIFSGLSSVYKYQSGEQSIRVAEENLATTRNIVRQDVRSALESLNTARELVESTREWAAEARKALNSSIDSYRYGVVSSVQIIQSQSGWESAEVSYINAKQSFQLAILNLRQSIGVDLETVYTEN